MWRLKQVNSVQMILTWGKQIQWTSFHHSSSRSLLLLVFATIEDKLGVYTQPGRGKQPNGIDITILWIARSSFFHYISAHGAIEHSKFTSSAV